MFEEIFTGKPKVRIRAFNWHFLFVWLVVVAIPPSNGQDYTFRVVEGTPAPKSVGKISGTPPFVLVQSYPGFTIDGQSGEIFATSRFDRESLLPTPEQYIRVRTGDNTELSIKIVVEDINDNAPTFHSPVHVVQIPENLNIGSDFPLDTAKDQDAGLNGTVIYAIISGNGTDNFKLGIGSNECSRSELCLITKNKLNREFRAFYQLNINASDQGNPPLHGNCLVNITILDYNDNAPVFTQMIYNGSVAENSNIGVSVVAVTATDSDESSNAVVRYSCSAGGFKIDPVSGVITSETALDRESVPFFTFDVEAQDLGSPPLKGKTTVNVYVQDVNEFKPEISVTLMSSTFMENQPNLRVAFVSVDDKDAAQIITVTISSGNELGHFTITYLGFGKLWQLSSVGLLDREDISTYNLTINATDNGRPSLSAFKSLIITLEDVNDNPPMFSSPSFDVSVKELVQPGTFVFRMNASDSDLGTNSLISYSILQDVPGWFYIDPTSGIITTAASLDRETHAEVVLRIMAKDHGSPPLNGSTSLKVTLLDGNDFAPYFDENVYNRSLSEDAETGAEIEKMRAVDKDTGENGRVTYEIDSGLQEITDSFAIDLNTGELTTRVRLDREKRDFYDIQIIAKDHGKPQHSTRTRVHLTVTDVNDNHPIYYPVVYYKTLSKGEQPQELLRVSATDADLGNNGSVLYGIADGTDQGLFSINRTSGVIRTVNVLTMAKLYQLNLTAKDGGGLYAVHNASVRITVLAAQDDPPVFKHGFYNYSIYENVPKGTLVGRVFATTKDPNSKIDYSIINGDPDHLFVMDSAGGIIKVNGMIDREEKTLYRLGVVAQVSSLSATTSVNIEVLDENDNIPEFASSSVQVEISGNLLAGGRVYHAQAVDADAGLNGIVRYQLIDDASGHFKINATSGVVELVSQIVGRDGSHYLLKIRASDLGSPPRHASLTLTVSIFTNHPPTFPDPTYTVPVSGNVPLGKQFLVVSAIDIDQGDNGVIQYRVAPGGNTEGLFGIFADGSLYVKKLLSQAKKSIYDITVIAEDNGSPPLNASAAVNIIIQDSTEHRALFTNSTYRFSIPENSQQGKQVGFLKASAHEPMKTMGIVYSFVSNQPNFVVNVRTGEITTIRMLDRERIFALTGSNELIMQAEAVYNDTKVMRDRTIVIVQILDLNDNSPVFSRQLYHTAVLEDARPGSVVFRLSTNDPDSGSNAKVVYSIMGGSGSSKFAINVTDGVISLKGELDRESVDHYSLEVHAVDAQDSSMFSETFVEIRVEDSNDNRPVFGDNLFVVNVSESLPIKSVVTILKATDRDLDINAELVYTIRSGNLEAVFSIDHSTGAVILAKSLDYETEQEYRINITVKDQGIPALFTQAELSININDANDNKPVFMDQPRVLKVLESFGKNKEIGKCNATDEDSGSNGKIVYSIQSQDPSLKTFGVDPDTCSIYTLEELDREAASQYKVIIQATDQAVPTSSRLVATKEITIQLEDVNDNVPRFISPLAAPVIASAGRGTSIMTISADDPDEGTNGQITYTITFGSAGIFQLDQSTGKLETQNVLDNNLIYTMTVLAKDAGKPSLSNETTITVFKEGAGGPTFTLSTYKVSVVENVPVGQSVSTVQAAYLSGNPSARIEYFITSDNSARTFGVGKTTGVVRTLDLVDHESTLGSVFILKIFAVDLSGQAPRTSSTNVEITVTDANDNRPEFSATEYHADIAENSASGVEVTAQVSASDKDSGENERISYNITGGNEGGTFAIHSNSGVISTTRLSLDREVQAEYRLIVTARDHGSPSLSSACAVIVTVKDVNDNTPEFTSETGFYSFAVYEDADVGSRVGAMTATDRDAGENAHISYHFPRSDVFDIDSSTGIILVTGSLDREQKQLYIFNVSAGDGHASSFITVYISILDRNDNAPSFVPSQYSAKIVEDTDINSSILTVSVLDRDHGTNAMISFHIVAGNNGGIFSILSNGTILNSKSLDREKKSSYLLEVTATDQAKPVAARLSRTAHVRISVTDLNDNTPYFDSKNIAHVSENADVGDVVMRVLVTDLDEGSNSDIVFDLRKIDPNAPFSLGSNDGILRVKGKLDREDKDHYSVEVTASDQGSPPRSAKSVISIIVDDFNDHSPVFKSHNNVLKVSEDISVLTEILSLSATDNDLGMNAKVRFDITSGNTDGDFFINAISGSLETAKPLDREQIGNYSLDIRAYDLGIPQQSAVTRVSVILLDVNDNSPRFEKSLYTAKVLENHLVGGIKTVVANDLDEGKNGQITYEIIGGNSDDSFVIDAHSGEIGLKKRLDREQEEKYTLQIKASDGGQLSDQTKITIEVLDENDNDPVFHPAVQKAYVQENMPSGTKVKEVSASDLDAGSYKEVTYSLDKSSPDSEFFDIGPTSGVIVTLTSLDRETEDTYKVKVYAKDKGNPERTGTVNIDITVEDVNDNRPEFDSEQYVATVEDNVNPGGIVFVVSAADKDYKTNAESSYSIAGGDTSLFQIGSRTGIITAVRNIPANSGPHFLTVEATNQVAPMFSDSASLKILVQPGPFPYFLHSSQSLNVSELVPAGSNLLKLNATAHTMYKIAAGNTGDAFEVDVQGYLKVKNMLDHGVQTNYTLVVEARDGSIPPQAGYVIVYISVIDENNNPPIFSKAYYQAAVMEDQPSNQTVIRVSASDADAGLNAETEYFIVQEGSGYSGFDISPKTGRLFSVVQLDRESSPLYSLKVRAENVRDRSLQDEATVQVTVLDVNDNPPVFEGSLSVSVPETADVGSDVITLTTIDKDEGSHATVKYDFVNSGNSGGFFSISPSGKVTLATKLDHETSPILRLQVTANDTKYITSEWLTVTVLDVNDNPPQFLAVPYIQHVDERAAVGTPVMNASAFDADTGSYAESLYTILPSVHSDLFAIGRKSGVIKLNQILFYQKHGARPNPNIYNLTVQARNVWSPFFEQTVSVVIQVTDINDHPPKFTSPVYSFSVTNGSARGAYVGKISAVDDEDDGVNAVVRYNPITGNGTSLFSISAVDGRITTAKELQIPGLFYIRVQAKDKGFPAKEDFTNLFIDVTEINAFAPKFEYSRFLFKKSEDLGMGSVIDTVTATDPDNGANGQITYAIVSGNSDGFFGIGHKNGSIYAAKPLDYEFESEFFLNVTATDGGSRPLLGSTTVHITLSNVNDNPPVFSPRVYHMMINENTKAGMSIGKVSAKDQDGSPVTYEIDTVEMRQFFSIDSSTGEIKSRVVFDYEIKNSYDLDVVARDTAFSSWPRAQVHIDVIGVNEFSPKFDKAVYRVAVAENALPGLSVATLSATDQDQGPDGQVVYLLVSLHDQGFSVEPHTGTLSVSGHLDSEKHSLVTLEVIAKNLYQDIVTPENSDLTSVIVTVTDANDKPRFLKSEYKAQIAEDAGVQTFVVNVTAVDDDAHQASNAKLVYSITQGNTRSVFHIDSATGVIRIAGNLDREVIPRYHLIVSAKDDGLPPLSGTAAVIVDLGDVNDNPPTLVNCTGHVRENRPSGSDVTILQPTDPDISPNQGPFTFSIAKTNFGKFQLNSKTGKITTTAKLDRELEGQYNLAIEITDNGFPQKSAISHCLIIVDDENDNPPLATSRIVHTTSFDKRFPGGAVGNVEPEDVDQVNSMTCQILSSSSGSPVFTFPARTCELVAPAYQNSGEFTLKLRASDGRASVDYSVMVKFLAYTAATLNQSMVMRLKDASPQMFLQQSYTKLLNALNDVIPSGYSPQLLSVSSGGAGIVDVLIAVQRDNSFVYLSRERVAELLLGKKSQLQTKGEVVIDNVDHTACTTNLCLNKAECSSFMKPTGFSSEIETIPVIFHSADYEWHYSCHCKRGYAGRHCESISNACSKQPCKNGGRCENHLGGYKCVCKPAFSGKNCEAAIDFCTPTPCKFNSTCVNKQATYQCVCDFGGRGELCQYSSLGFDPVSYMMLPTLKGSTKNNITLEFATSKQKGLIFYNTDAQYKQDSDFIALEIVGGKLRFSFNLGESPVTIESPKSVTDGKWHTVMAVRKEKMGELVVDSAGKETATSKGALMQLNLYASPLFIGGVKDFEHTLGHPAGHISSYDFVGCMREVYINGKAVRQSDVTAMQGINDRCPRVDSCAVEPCQHGGKCLDGWFNYICECLDGYMGRNCEKETKPFTFSGSSFMVMEFKEDYRREQAVKEKEEKTVRSRRAVGPGDRVEEFSLTFRTRLGGLLVLAEDAANNYTVLEVKSGLVRYTFKTTVVKSGLSAAEVNVSDGEWHSVSLKHDKNNIDIVVDGKPRSYQYDTPPHSFLGSNIMMWSLGGFTTPPEEVALKTFQGCMEDFSIDGLQLSLEGPNRFATLVPHGGSIGEGCSGSNVCYPNPCTNPDKLYCFLEWETHTCISDAQCKPNPCRYNGTCLPQKDGSFNCKCQTNYSGDTCEIVPACQGSPCKDDETCQGIGISTYKCVPAGSGGLSTGIIAAIVFFVVLVITFIIAVLFVRRYRLNQRSTKTARDFDGVEAAADVQDASQRTSPSHSSDDSGVVIKNPSQKSLTDLRASSMGHTNEVVIHSVGAPEDYQIKLTKSDDKIDHGFSEYGDEIIVQNKYNSERPIGHSAPKSGRAKAHHRSAPLVYDVPQRTANHRLGKAHKLTNPHFKYGRQRHSLSRTVLDPRRRPNGYVIPNSRARRASAGSLSSDEMQDCTNTGHFSDFDNNSEMIEHYDIDVASIGFSEISYQYDPNQFKDPVNYKEQPGLSPAEIERLQHHAPSGSLLDAVSLATSDNGAPSFDKLSSILEPPDTSSESSDDTFTCSEFDCDEHDESRVPSRLSRDEQNQGSMLFSRLPHRENDGINSDENSPRASVSTVSDDEVIPQPINGSGELLNWDDLLNWGLRYHNLRGVYKDIAQLKDSVPSRKNGEYV